MANDILHAPHRDEAAHEKGALDKAIEQAVHDLQAAAAQIHKGSDDLLSRAATSLNDAAASLAAQVRRQSAYALQEAHHDVRAHPLAAAAAVAVAAATLAGLVVASLTHSPPPPPPKHR